MTADAVLLIGGGGREHALAWKIAQSPLVGKLVAMPGSDGIAALPKCSCAPGRATDVEAAVRVARELEPALVVVGPDDPLALGVVDALEAAGFAVAGPRREAARLESSKIFAKEFMAKNGIPTAPFTVCDSAQAALGALARRDVEGAGVVIKADGLAQGKGVVVTHERALAEQTVHDFMLNDACTVKSDRLLLEDKLAGKEVSAFALCDGETFVPLGYACDYKRVGDNDQGPNTGGMGCYTPHGWPSAAARDAIQGIFRKVVDGMKARGTPFRGFLFAGLMVDGDDVKVIEFNARMGDPETQTLLPLMRDDIVPLLRAAARGGLAGEKPPAFLPGAAVHVVMASEGYPDTMGRGMRLGEEITIPASLNDNGDAHLFIAGARKKDGVWVNSGGRVLGVTARGATVEEARSRAYEILGGIRFNGAHWRRDIGR